MQEKQKKELNKESDRQGKNSVYDFLYHDAQRIASFLSQFDPSGHLKTLTLSDIDSSGSQYGANANIEGSVHAAGEIPCLAEGKFNAKGNLYGDMSFNTGNENNYTRTYDPLWQNSLAFLDYLEKENLINREAPKSRISQFVLVTGQLVIFDIGFIQKILKETSLKKIVVQNVAGGKSNKSNANLGVEIFGSVPAAIQAHLHCPGFSTWSTLKSEGLSLSTDDLHLKHGLSIAGEWSILGIIDALPSSDEADISQYPLLLRHFNEFLGEIKKVCGRPSNYFGVTPLLVFREVTGD